MATWDLSGDDAGDFRISSVGVLTFKATPDHENPVDADMDNMYMVTVNANDGMIDAERAVTIRVTDVDEEAPIDTETLRETYDADDSGTIDKEEARAAVTDYFDGVISKEEARAVITAYFDDAS